MKLCIIPAFILQLSSSFVANAAPALAHGETIKSNINTKAVPIPNYPVPNAGQKLYIYSNISLVRGASAKQEIVTTEVQPQCVAPTPQGCAYSIPQATRQENAWVSAGVEAQHYTIWNDDIRMVTKGHPLGYPDSTASFLTTDVKFNVLVDINRFHASIGAVCSSYQRRDICERYEHGCERFDTSSGFCAKFSEAKCASYKTVMTCTPTRYYIHNPSDNNTTTVPAREITESCTDAYECSRWGFPAGSSWIINFLQFPNK